MVDLNELDNSKLIAKRNYDAFVVQFPQKLAKKEEKFFKNFKKINGDSIKKLLKIYSFMDELYEFVKRFTPCNKGCSHCCYYPVSISEIEIQYVEKSLNIKRIEMVPLALPRTRCPFLIGESCSIYQARPFMCRRHVTFDRSSKWCHTVVSDESEMLMLRFSEVDKAYDHIVREGGIQNIFDIREVFTGQAHITSTR